VEVVDEIKGKRLAEVDEVAIGLEEGEEKKVKVKENASSFQMVTRASARTAAEAAAVTVKTESVQNQRLKTSALSNADRQDQVKLRRGRFKGEKSAAAVKGKQGRKGKR
jgi:sporulation protein YlmC with PRC-barrel domain